MRIALCQIDTTMGDLDGNRARVVRAAQQAAAAGAELAIFPELTLAGYPARDLLDRPAFVDDNLRSLEQLAREAPPAIALLAGFVDRTPGAVRHNAAALVRDGAVAQVFHKQLLPTYDVFDEARYFEPGTRSPLFELSGTRFGVTICEDAFNAVEGPLRQVYDHDPVSDAVAAGAQVLINLSGSPFNLLKRQARPAMFSAIARKHGRPLVFVNLVGGNDDILFDGSSAVYGPDGAAWAEAPSFEEHVLVCELASGQARAARPGSDAGAALEALVMGTRDYAHKCGFRSAVVGLSGGIDSALVAAVATRALGAGNVLGVAMPTRYSSEGSVRDARALAQALGIGFRVISIDAIFQRYLDVLGPELEGLGPAGANDTTFENMQARIRGNTLMAISNRRGHLLLTTGNKSEIAVGYCTLYGDMAGGLAVVSDLPKTFVYEVAREWGTARPARR